MCTISYYKKGSGSLYCDSVCMICDSVSVISVFILLWSVIYYYIPKYQGSIKILRGFEKFFFLNQSQNLLNVTYMHLKIDQDFYHLVDINMCPVCGTTHIQMLFNIFPCHGQRIWSNDCHTIACPLLEIVYILNFLSLNPTLDASPEAKFIKESVSFQFL